MSENKQSKRIQNSVKKSTIPDHFPLNDTTNRQNGRFTTTPRKREQKQDVKSQSASKSKRIKKEPLSNKKTQSAKKQRTDKGMFNQYGSTPRSQPKCRKRLIDNLKPSTSTSQDNDIMIIVDDEVIEITSSPEILNDTEPNSSSDSEVNIQIVAPTSQQNLLELSKTSSKIGTFNNMSHLQPSTQGDTNMQTNTIKSKKITKSSPSTQTQPFIRLQSKESGKPPKPITQNFKFQYNADNLESTSVLSSNTYDATFSVEITNTPKKTKIEYRRQSVTEPTEEIVEHTYEKNFASPENTNDENLTPIVANTQSTISSPQGEQNSSHNENPTTPRTTHPGSSIASSEDNNSSNNNEDFVPPPITHSESSIASSEDNNSSNNNEDFVPPITHPESSIASSEDNNSSNNEDSVPGPDHSSNGYEDNDVQPASQHNLLPMHYQRQDFHTYENHSNAIIDRGSFGTILIAFNQTLSLVAIKCIQCPPNNRHIADKIVKEIDLHRIGQSPNVIPIYGVMTLNSSVGIIMEYMHAGNLKNLLLNRDINIQPGLILRMFWEAAKGIAFLHNALMNQGIIHGDLKPSNFMLDSGLHVKVGDLGGSRLASITGSSQESRIGTEGETTLAYMAPERLENHNTMTRESDVYSFAICMWVGLTRSEPVVGNRREFRLSVINGQRPSIENINDERNIDNNATQNAIIPKIKDIMQECWSQNPSDRPTMIEVRDRLEDILKYEAMADIANHATQVSLQMQFKHFPSQSDHPSVCLENFNHFE